MPERTRRTIDYANRAVRLTDERLGHIYEHPEMVGQERRISDVLKKPDIVFTSHKDAQSMYTTGVTHAVRLGQST